MHERIKQLLVNKKLLQIPQIRANHNFFKNSFLAIGRPEVFRKITASVSSHEQKKNGTNFIV